MCVCFRKLQWCRRQVSDWRSFARVWTKFTPSWCVSQPSGTVAFATAKGVGRTFGRTSGWTDHCVYACCFSAVPIANRAMQCNEREEPFLGFPFTSWGQLFLHGWLREKPKLQTREPEAFLVKGEMIDVPLRTCLKRSSGNAFQKPKMQSTGRDKDESIARGEPRGSFGQSGFRSKSISALEVLFESVLIFLWFKREAKRKTILHPFFFVGGAPPEEDPEFLNRGVK